MKRNKLFELIAIFFVSFVIYIAGTLPLRETFAVFTVTDVRPGAALNPFMSLCFGPAASLGCAISTFIADFFSGYPTKVLFQGLPLQFIYGFVPYIVWKKLTKGDDHSYRIDSIKKYAIFTLISFLFGILSGFGVGYIVYSNFGANFFETVGFVFMNNFTFTMLLGFPLMICANIVISGIGKEVHRKLSKSEYAIIFSSVIEFVGIAIITYKTYSSYAGVSVETYDVWNNIFIYSVVFVNIMIVLTIVVLHILNRKKGNA